MQALPTVLKNTQLDYASWNSQKDTSMSLLFSHFHIFKAGNFLTLPKSLLTTFLHYFVAGINLESLTHKTTESVKSSWDSGLGIDFD